MLRSEDQNLKCSQSLFQIFTKRSFQYFGASC